TNPDPSFPNERGQVPGNGAILAALEVASGQIPLVVGKPEPHLYRQAIERMGTDPEHTLVLGDRLETDIQGGIRLGSPTALLMTGVTDQATAKSSEIKPTYVFEDLPELLQSLKGAD
ncbi:MAG: HAD-IIA family hydrolase, partial [Anaerolineales bacterium]